MLNRRIAAIVVALSTVAIGVVSASASAKANAVDRAFVREMVPHHEMAVQMAEMARTQGDHAQIKKLASRIISAQTREIRELKAIARSIGVRPGNADSMDHMQMMDDAQAMGVSMDAMGMDMNMDMLDGAKPFDRMFITMMVAHHKGAIVMARAEMKKGVDARLRSIARGIITAQNREIRQMAAWKKAWYGGSSHQSHH